MDMLALLCENVKLAEVVSECDLELVTFFLQNNMYSQSPSFRQHLVALCKKVHLSHLNTVSQCFCSYSSKENVWAGTEPKAYVCATSYCIKNK
jgi:hypothetical protein